jgi:branched-chain amino acid transport system permease protein
VRWVLRGPWTAPITGILALGAATALFIGNASSYHMFIFNTVLLAVIGASALNLLMGTVGQVSIGNAAFLVVGAFSVVVARQLQIGFPFDLLVAIGAGAATGFIVGLPGIRIRGVYLALTTLAANFIFVEIAQKYQSIRAGAAGFIIPRLFRDTTLLDQQRAWAVVLFGFVAAVLILVRCLTTARIGRAWRLIRSHEIVAPSLGIPVAGYKLGAFMLSSALISLQGALGAHFSGYVSADSFTLTLAISYVAMVLIGGPDSQFGSVIGAAVVIWLPFLTASVIESIPNAPPTAAAQVALISYGALIVFFITLSPDGLAGWLRWAVRPLIRRIASG